MANGATAIDSKTAWSIVCKDFPFKQYGDTKDLSAHTWLDNNGDDEFIPPQLFLKAYEVDVTFVCYCPSGQANGNIQNFLNYLTGNDGLIQGAALMVYDAYTKVGKQNVRFVSVSDEGIYRREGTDDVVEFKVRFKINDPVTNIIPVTSEAGIVSLKVS